MIGEFSSPDKFIIFNYLFGGIYVVETNKRCFIDNIQTIENRHDLVKEYAREKGDNYSVTYWLEDNIVAIVHTHNKGLADRLRK